MQTSSPDPGVLASLGWIDLTALAILLVFFVLGLFRGFVWQIGRIVTLVLAYAVAGMYGGEVAARIDVWFDDGVPANLPLYIAYFTVFMAVLVVVSLLAHFAEKLVHRTGLSFYNRMGGGLLGVGTGVCVVMALLAGILMFLGSGSSIVQAAQSSRSMRVSKNLLEALGGVVPAPVLEVFGVEPPPEPASSRPLPGPQRTMPQQQLQPETQTQPQGQPPGRPAAPPPDPSTEPLPKSGTTGKNQK